MTTIRIINRPSSVTAIRLLDGVEVAREEAVYTSRRPGWWPITPADVRSTVDRWRAEAEATGLPVEVESFDR